MNIRYDQRIRWTCCPLTRSYLKTDDIYDFNNSYLRTRSMKTIGVYFLELEHVYSNDLPWNSEVSTEFLGHIVWLLLASIWLPSRWMLAWFLLQGFYPAWWTDREWKKKVNDKKRWLQLLGWRWGLFISVERIAEKVQIFFPHFSSSLLFPTKVTTWLDVIIFQLTSIQLWIDHHHHHME